MQTQPVLFPEFEQRLGAPLCAGTFSPVVIAEAPDEIRDLPDGELEEKIVKAKAVLKWVMARFRTAFSTSFGKDSSATLGIALAAAAELVREGAVVQPFVVLTADTLVENPSVHALALREMAKVKDWIERYKLPATTHVARPNLSSQFAVAVIGGRALPSLAGHKRDCTSDLKSVPLSRVRKAVLGKNDLPAGKFVVSITGVRKAESVVRAANVTRRKESDVAIVQTNEDGNVALAPILGWDWDDVFGYLGLCTNGFEHTYSDMRDVIDTYREATGECVIASSDEEDAKASKPCQSRFGCWNCLQVKDDRSMDQMVQEPQHAYMKPLARFRTFLKNTFYDLSRRTWVGRTIDENGYIRFAVDGYSPPMLQELLKYALTIDIEERESAARLGIAPRYQIVSLEALFAICASWSSQGFSRPFEGLRIYSEIEKGARYPVPDVPEFPKVPIPPARYIKVGKGWNAGIDWQYTGLRDPMIEAIGFGGNGCIGHRQIFSKGEPRIIMDVNTGPEFSIDPEGAALFMMFEMERYVEEWHGSNARKALAMEGHHVAGVEYRTYVSYGFLSVAKGQEAKVDEIMRRTAWRERLGLAGYQYDHERALAMSVEASVPEIPSQDEVEASRRAEVARTRRIKRDALQQKRINLKQLYTEWAPDVPWRHMVQKGQLPMVALPRNRKGRLVLRHLITPYRLADFLSNNPFVVARVRAHRGKKLVGQTLDLFRLAA